MPSMMNAGVRQAKSNLSRLIDAALSGEDVVISNRGVPLVKVVPAAAHSEDSNRGYGCLKGMLNLPKGWDSPEADEDVTRLFEGL